MNELEKEIKNKFINWVSDSMHQHAFQDGADFVLSKNLPVLFIIWLHSFESRTEEERALVRETAHLSIDKTAMMLYKYWINNIYGK